MDTILGLLGVVVWIASTIGIAAGITYVVVRLFPGDESLKPTSES
ncbi:MAG TPA: hypothetical protein VD769_05255 [Gaiellaceae bacterium]|nr:hypothetical protein [Gaiellaceae bacterium]